MEKKVYIETLGCQMNKSDTERILGMLELIGYEQTEDFKQADLLIINTCNIRQLSADKAYSYLGVWGKLKREKPHIKIAMCGCVAQQEKQKVRQKAPYVDLVFGTLNIPELPSLIKQIEHDDKIVSIHKDPISRSEECSNVKRPKGQNAWLPIIDGCDYFCTYCVVPYVRGRQRSRKMSDIIEEAKNIAKQGYREITLLGQTVDSYGRDTDDPDCTLANLLRELNKIDDIYRIRFVTSYPTDITDDLIKAVKELDKVCEYFHIPMQSGSSQVLENMKRRYTREQYIEIAKKIADNIPDVAITSDFIAGFPGETQEQFEETLSIIDELNFDHCNTAAYSPRKQTPAATWRDKYIDNAEKKKRLNVLNEKVKEAAKISNEKYVGRQLEVLVESFKEQNGNSSCSGRTRNNKIVHFESSKDLTGTLVNINIKEASVWCLKGEMT